MPEALGTEILELSNDFAPVPTSEWEAAIARDLKGADYQKKLVWRTDDGIPVLPYYRRDVLDPLGDLANLAPGEFPYTRGDGQDTEEAQNWIPPAGVIHGEHLHEAGATAVQELGFTLAEAVEKLAAAIDAGKSVDAAASGAVFVYAIGSNYFFEIAKLRAARVLWSTAVSAFEPEDRHSCMARIHACTARSNKSLFDPYSNLLRVTTETASAMIGGCDSLTVESIGFEPHLGLNVQRILREEAHLTQVLDPAGGSYYLEALTDSLAQAAWKLFQEVETSGGWSAALATGLVERALTGSRQVKAAAISSRRRVLVGVNNYPNVAEKTSDVRKPLPLANDPFPETRLAEPFEGLRQRSAAHAQLTGRYPKILLLKRGDPKMRMARSIFCLNFFGCAGFDLVEAEDYAGTDADLVVLCSADAEYLSFAQEVCANVRVPVLVAGNPKEQIPALRSAGVQGFIHLFSNALETLTDWQDKLGMRAVPKE